MHSLDKYINDLEPRIISICKNAPTQEEPSLQSSLSSYGWILLDSWVAWRTLRFLLKDCHINDEIQDKWVQTPSSYTSNQLRAAWHWDAAVIEFLESKTGKNLKTLIDNTVQKKRNSCAHFNRKSDVTGADSREIKQIFDALSVVFNACELDEFLREINRDLASLGYSVSDIYIDTINTDLRGVHTKLHDFERLKEIRINYIGPERKISSLLIKRNGCYAGVLEEGVVDWKDVINEQVDKYSLLGNKGFYLDTDLFCKTVIMCW